MKRSTTFRRHTIWLGACSVLLFAGLLHGQEYEKKTYMPVVIEQEFATTMAFEKAEKSRCLQRQRNLF